MIGTEIKCANDKSGHEQKTVILTYPLLTPSYKPSCNLKYSSYVQ